MNIPNALTMLRMLMIPFMVSVFNKYGAQWALIVFVLASITDVLDGYIARKYNQITDFGKLMDPLADKLMTITMLYMLAVNSYIPIWVMFVVACKEAVMVLGAAMLLGGKKVVVMSNKLGKSATALFFVAIVCISLRDIAHVMWTIGTVIMYIAVAMAAVAMLGYGHAYLIKGRNDRTIKPGEKQ